MSQDQAPNLWDRIWKDRNGKIVIFQMPNVWLLLWAALATASIFVPRGTAQDVLYWSSSALLVVWALLELFKGVNYFRRALGLVILAITIAGAVGFGR
ncbi:MAG: hypothetical protein JWO35_348 [Candidatus Saccharibacteria bacterium]|nr:hypothetical protein [Candidatus Saccharibacteria bacterium]